MKKSLSEHHAEFINECRYTGKLSEKTLTGYRVAFAALVAIFPNLSIDDLCPKLIAQFFERLDKRKRVLGHGVLKSGIKKTTVVTYRNRLNRFFVWLRHRQLLSSDPFDGMNFPTVSYDDVQYLKREEVEKIFSALALGISWSSAFIRKRNLLLFSTLLYAGLRRNELLNLKLYDVDLERSLLTVRGESSKSERTRTLPICSSLVVPLKDYLAERNKQGVQTPYLYVSSTRDNGLTNDGLKKVEAKVSVASGVRFHLHQFRHTFAVNLINQGVDISKVKELLGHRSILSTIVYVRSLPSSALKRDVESLSFDSLI